MRTHWSSKCVVETSPTEQAAVLEAYIAAVFLEGGLPAVNEFVIPLMQTVGEHELV
jgi:dsRNA-specific ribonuclease